MSKMGESDYISFRDVYEAERQILEDAVTEAWPNDYARATVDLVKRLEAVGAETKERLIKYA